MFVGESPSPSSRDVELVENNPHALLPLLMEIFSKNSDRPVFKLLTTGIEEEQEFVENNSKILIT